MLGIICERHPNGVYVRDVPGAFVCITCVLEDHANTCPCLDEFRKKEEEAYDLVSPTLETL
jgi:hypothetical protein